MYIHMCICVSVLNSTKFLQNIGAKVYKILKNLKKKIILYPLTGWAARHCGLSIPWIIEVFKEPSSLATLICVSSNSELIQYKLRETQSTVNPLILWISVQQERENHKWMKFLMFWLSKSVILSQGKFNLHFNLLAKIVQDCNLIPLSALLKAWIIINVLLLSHLRTWSYN